MRTVAARRSGADSEGRTAFHRVLVNSLFVFLRNKSGYMAMPYTEHTIGELERFIPYFGGLREMALERKRVYCMVERADAPRAFIVHHWDAADRNPFVILKTLAREKAAYTDTAGQTRIYLDKDAAKSCLETMKSEVYAPETNPNQSSTDFVAQMCYQLVLHCKRLLRMGRDKQLLKEELEAPSQIFVISADGGHPLTLYEASSTSAAACWRTVRLHVNTLCESRQFVIAPLPDLSSSDPENVQINVCNMALAKLADAGYMDLKLPADTWSQLVQHVGLNPHLLARHKRAVYICDGALYEGAEPMRLLDMTGTNFGLHPFAATFVLGNRPLQRFPFEPIASRDIHRKDRGAGTAYTILRCRSMTTGRLPLTAVSYVFSRWLSSCVELPAALNSQVALKAAEELCAHGFENEPAPVQVCDVPSSRIKRLSVAAAKPSAAAGCYNQSSHTSSEPACSGATDLTWSSCAVSSNPRSLSGGPFCTQSFVAKSRSAASSNLSSLPASADPSPCAVSSNPRFLSGGSLFTQSFVAKSRSADLSSLPAGADPSSCAVSSNPRFLSGGSLFTQSFVAKSSSAASSNLSSLPAGANPSSSAVSANASSGSGGWWFPSPADRSRAAPSKRRSAARSHSESAASKRRSAKLNQSSLVAGSFESESSSPSDDPSASLSSRERL